MWSGKRGGDNIDEGDAGGADVGGGAGGAAERLDGATRPAEVIMLYCFVLCSVLFCFSDDGPVPWL